MEQQWANKKQSLQNGLENLGLKNLPEIQIQSIGPTHLRERMDFVIEDGRIGLYAKQIEMIVDLPSCPLLTPALQNYYEEFRRIPWPIHKGSFRLRVGPSGEKGAWLDFSHVDTKILMDEQKMLLQLSSLGFVEIGQRRKVLEKTPEKFSLREPVLRCWSKTTYLGQTLSLFGTVGSFSQTGALANQVIVDGVARLTKNMGHRLSLEYGAGNGNLTFPSMNESNRVQVIETDLLALQGLRKTAEEFSLGHRIEILNPKETPDFSKVDLILANPPRSGLSHFLPKLIETKKPPKNFIYMSCFPESFLNDAKVLKDLNYRLQEIEIIDQFPHTHHYEILSRWDQS